MVVPTFWCAIIFFSCIFLVLFIFGVACLAEALENVDYEKRYDNLCENEAASGTSCTFTISLSEDFESPHIYYKMGNFYANHRKYVMSRSYEQLRGEKVSKGDVKEFCDPILANKDIPTNMSYTGNALNDNDLAYPCGLIGKYRFTDRFAFMNSNSTTIPIDSSTIAHTNDKDLKFKNVKNSENIQWLDHEQQHLMVWYQMESFPDFIKFYGKMNGKLPKGDYTVTVSDLWDTKAIKAEKYLYISTVNDLGGTNVFLGKHLVFNIIS